MCRQHLVSGVAPSDTLRSVIWNSRDIQAAPDFHSLGFPLLPHSSSPKCAHNFAATSILCHAPDLLPVTADSSSFIALMKTSLHFIIFQKCPILVEKSKSHTPKQWWHHTEEKKNSFFLFLVFKNLPRVYWDRNQNTISLPPKQLSFVHTIWQGFV